MKTAKIPKVILCQFHHEIRASIDCLEIFVYYSSPKLFLSITHLCCPFGAMNMNNITGNKAF